jgi:RNA polymerase sigma-70 factor (ECF subfamily)
MSQPEHNDEELLQRAGRRDPRAFEQLYDRLAPRLYGLLRQMLHDEREAEDVLQDSFVQLWDRAPGFDPARSKAFTWSVMIVRHKAIDRMRMLGRRNRLVESAALERSVLDADSAVAADAGQETAERAQSVHHGIEIGVVDEKIDPAHTRSKLTQALAEAPQRRGRHKNIPL